MSQPGGIPPVYETERVLLRPLTAADVTPEYVSWWNDPELQIGLGSAARNWDIERAVRHVQSFNNKTKFHFGIFLKPGYRLAGFYTLNTDPRQKVSSSTTMIADKSLWRKGLAREISEKMLEIRFRDMGMEKIEGKVRGENRASKALFEKLGFKREGVLKKHGPAPGGGRIDITLYGLTREEWKKGKNLT